MNKFCWRLIFLTFVAFILLKSSNQQKHHCGDVNSGADTLQLVVVVFRHGDRTPTATYPTSPYPLDYWMKYGGYGQLTPVGVKQQMQFGRWMRKCYGNFLNKTASVNDVYVRSTDTDRTIMSAEAHLAGVYQIDDESWLPSPVRVVPQVEDKMLFVCPPAICRLSAFCPAYSSILPNDGVPPQIMETQIANQGLIDYISQQAGFSNQSNPLKIIGVISDEVYIEMFYQLQLPAWINKTVLQLFDSWRNVISPILAGSDDLIRYNIGPLVANLQDTLFNKSNGSFTKKHVIYSAHDTTVSCLMAAYGHALNTTPPYNAAVITELHYNSVKNSYFVKTFYRNDTDADPYLIRVRNCGFSCPLTRYIEHLNPFRFADKASFCKSSH